MSQKLTAVHIETGADGAVFAVRVEVADRSDPLDSQRQHHRVLNAVDAFCHSFLDGSTDVEDGLGGEGMDQFDDWPCGDYGIMPFKYRDLGVHRGEVVIIIADRWLAARFNRAFCARPGQDRGKG